MVILAIKTIANMHFIAHLFLEAPIDINELYQDDDFYTQVMWWCIPLILIVLYFGSVIYLKLREQREEFQHR